MENNGRTAKVITIAFLMALEVALTRFFSFFLPFLRIGLGFLPISVIGILYGPLWAGSAYALGDFMGAVLFPAGAYFPGFTLSAFLSGTVYGLFLHKKNLSWKRLFMASAVVCLGVNLFLDTFWLYILMGNGVFGIIPARLFKSVLMFAIQPLLIHLVQKRILSKVKL